MHYSNAYVAEFIDESKANAFLLLDEVNFISPQDGNKWYFRCDLEPVDIMGYTKSLLRVPDEIFNAIYDKINTPTRGYNPKEPRPDNTLSCRPDSEKMLDHFKHVRMILPAKECVDGCQYAKDICMEEHSCGSVCMYHYKGD